MLMTTGRLMLLRGCNVTLGRFAPVSRLLRYFLVRLLVKGKDRYVASSRYFDPKELG